MKTKLSLLFVLMAAFFLTSCGAKKTATTFEVSTSALSVNNTVFTGGLVITGTNGKDSFVYPIASGSGSGSSITLDLPKQTWTFSAIGWESVPSTPFNGDSKCGSVTVDLKDDAQTVALNIDYAKCSSQTSAFGSSAFRTGNSFDLFKVVTCGWLYESDGSTVVSSSTALNYCDTASTVDAKYKRWARSIYVEVLKDENGSKSAGLGQCFSPGSDGLFTTTMSFPQLGIPVQVSLYSDTGCPSNPDLKFSTFSFNSGLGGSNSDFDAVFTEQSTTAKLFLPSYDTRRGFSSFLANKPILLCNGNPCLAIPTSIPGGSNRIISSEDEFVLTATPAAGQSCATIFAVSPVGITPVPTVSDIISRCEERDGRMTLRLNFSTLTAASLGITFTNATTTNLTLESNGTRDAHHFAWNMLGYPLTPAPTNQIKYSFKAFFSDSGKDAGLLSEVREMMGPEGAGGVLGSGLNCLTSTSVNFVSFRDEGENKTYKIELQNAGATPLVGVFLAVPPVLATDSFDKKILISQKKSDGTFAPQMMMHFNCGTMVGRMFSIHNKTGKSEKRLLEWNTDVPALARVREMIYEEERDATRITRAFTAFRYAEFPSDATKVYARAYELQINWNGTDYDFSPRSYQATVSSSIPGFTFVQTNPISNNNANRRSPKTDPNSPSLLSSFPPLS